MGRSCLIVPGLNGRDEFVDFTTSLVSFVFMYKKSETFMYFMVRHVSSLGTLLLGIYSVGEVFLMWSNPGFLSEPRLDVPHRPV